MKSSTLAIHEGTLKDKVTGGVNTPLYTSSACNYMDRGEAVYPRYFNAPNQDAVARKQAALEHAEAGLVFSSGMGAMSTSILAYAGSGDHVVMLDAIYGGTHHFATEWFSHFGIDCTFTLTSAEDVIQKVTPKTRVIVIESPTNPLLAVVDIKKIARFAREKKITPIIDNIFASPVNQTPIDLGMDIVVHSGTKYLGGHSDLCCGMVACSKEKMTRILSLAKVLGPSLDPRLCHLLERSIKTLFLRVNTQTQNAMEVASFLESRPAVEKVYYPGLEAFEGHEIAKRQMTGFGAMLSFEIRGHDPDRFIESLSLIRPAVSLGGVESTICPLARTSHAKMSKAERERVGVTDGLLRLSVGLEDAEDLKQDLDAALHKISKDDTQMNTENKTSPVFTELGKKIIALLQTDIPVVKRPFLEMAEQIGITEEEFLRVLKDLNDRGMIRRFGATLKHQKSGFKANAMVAWKVAEDRVEQTGNIMAGFQEITHCYRRNPAPGWRYNLYTMVHAGSEEAIHANVKRISEAVEEEDYEILFSRKELKKTSMNYFED